MIQGGDPTKTGKGGTSVWGRKFKDQFDPTLQHHTRGIVSMANSGPDTNGSQFFITYAKHMQLNNVYTIFGRVIFGWDTLATMEKAPVKGEKPIEDLVLKKITIHANPFAT
eukprot:TRINITY_DN11451_c0_g1_i1.p1 TRINITY_DN11451_c0_g1~~TRINITY_DN11451_c0_g1_i1.p1  ORF type:complete len:111 (+),score=21.51 TRINITY_DN11451_c0_g1_i1:237-569(+)